MRLYLAVAVFMLAFVAFTEAQEETLETKFNKFGEHVTELGRTIAVKVTDTFQNMQDSDLAETTRNWFSDQLTKLKAKYQELSQ